MVLTRPICVAGAGSVGCFVGGILAAAGRDVSLLARPRVISEINNHGLKLTSLEGLDRVIAPHRLSMSEDPSMFKDAGTVLVTVKSADTAGIADMILRHAPLDVTVISLQNGVGNVLTLRERLPGRHVLAGMVPFNVMSLGDGRFHRATGGDVIVEQDAADTAAQLSVPGLAMRGTDNITGIQWGKLLINLNNALNALSNRPLLEQFTQRPWRSLLADQLAEALMVLKAERIETVSTTPIPYRLMPYVLRLPNALFDVLLGRKLKIDPQARSSMWEDLQRKRRTEIDYLQGVITQMADRHGLDVPLSRRVVALIKKAEADNVGSPALTPERIRRG